MIPNPSVPEELVQIQAYLRWERKGKQIYTPEQEKASYYLSLIPHLSTDNTLALYQICSMPFWSFFFLLFWLRFLIFSMQFSVYLYFSLLTNRFSWFVFLVSVFAWRNKREKKHQKEKNKQKTYA